MAKSSKPEKKDDDEHPAPSMGGIVREWTDALVIAFVLAMFVRVFVVELFKIPTGSMTPTLIGDEIAEVDLDGDGRLDYVVRGQSQTLAFLNHGERYDYDQAYSNQVTSNQLDAWKKEGLLRARYDRILVNKFAYWFEHPKRGDVTVFKVPDAIWDPAKPIYIKRVVGEPGDRIEFAGRLRVDGEPVEEPEFFKHQSYLNDVTRGYHGFVDQPYAKYSNPWGPRPSIQEVNVPETMLYVMGDNTRSSLDSRYWGGVPLENVKGKAFMRYWPLKKMKFIE